MQRRTIVSLLAVGGMLAAASTTSRADFVALYGDAGSQINLAEDNSGSNSTGSGTVDGTTINITASENVTFASGNATIKAVGTQETFQSVTFEPVDSEAFSSFSLRGQLNTVGPGDEVKITVTDQFAQEFTFNISNANADFSPIGVVARTGSGEKIASVTVTGLNSSEFYQVKQIEFGTLTVVPEPTTMVAGALLLLPFGISTLRLLRKKA